MIDLLLDTHIFLWWVTDASKLPLKYVSLLNECEKKGHSFYLSMASLWEIAKLVSKKKYELPFPLEKWFSEIEQNPLVSLVSISPKVILDSISLGSSFHKDPFDQVITATARCHGLQLLTLDRAIIESKVVSII